MVRRSDAARLLPTTVVHFTPEDNNTHSRLELAFTDVLPKKLTKLSFSGGHFALNYTKMSDRALIEIPIEISKTVRTINDELPPLLNFTLFFWCMQLPLLVLAGLYISSLDADAMLMAPVATVVALLIPPIALRIAVKKLAQELRRLAVKHNKTYFLQVGVKELVPFWSEGGGFFKRRDCFMTGIGFGSLVYLFVQVEFGAPKISDERSSMSWRNDQREMLRDEGAEVQAEERVSESRLSVMMAGMKTSRNSMRADQVTPVLPVTQADTTSAAEAAKVTIAQHGQRPVPK
eukprot:CAMPEP_0182477368 /NCGR_PEP_ID=MMETSP1319-20130603/30770_1 /TAXON_ID=172717 /ORGANISM="Bolidomonas pacifica, Strain RCC208" /LENGTH=289 /DNA_ID=CAMNT_0024678583 /DNA_START=340 /DNA_END=1206 /DNA_ORIENTATION=+